MLATIKTVQQPYCTCSVHVATVNRIKAMLRRLHDLGLKNRCTDVQLYAEIRKTYKVV